ncbi:MAG: Uma2 family endonuclease [Pirellulales bacterium]
MSTATRITTADELLQLPDDGYRYELIEGELRQMTPAGFTHGFVISEVHGRLWNYISERKLGILTGAETGFIVGRNPDTVLAADVAFVRQSRVDKLGFPNEYFPEAPALVVEVVSPGDTIEEVDSKMRRWLAVGVELVWVPYPRGRTVTVYRSLDDIRVLTANDALDGGDVVPGFSVRVGDLFSALDR